MGPRRIQANNLTIPSYGASISNVVLEVVKVGIFGISNGITLDLRSATLVIGSSAIVSQIQYFSFTGYGSFVMNGTWTTINSQFSNILLVPLSGNGNWSFISSAASFATPVTITGEIRLTKAVLNTAAVPGSFVFNRILGDQDSQINIFGQTLFITELVAASVSDYTTISANISNLSVIRYDVNVGGNKYFGSGSVGTLYFNQGHYQGSLNNIQINQLESHDGNTIAIRDVTKIFNFKFFGGTVWQQDSSGIFNVNNATYLGTNSLKYIKGDTILDTLYLDCTQCGSPDCALGLNDWNHVRTTSSIGCII